MRTLGVGLIGCGTIGTGVAKLIVERGDLMAERSGIRPVLRWVADKVWDVDRPVDLSGVACLSDLGDHLADADVDVVVELVGGIEPARTFVRRALEHGKHVVTANKALLSQHGRELFALAREKGVRIGYEASVGGGIPIMRAIEAGFTADRIDRLYGIINGTANFILSRMDEEGASFADVLAEASRLGYAEADPSYDVDGIDTAHKLVLLVHLALGRWVSLEDVFTEGIRHIEPIDMAFAREFGFRIKLLAIAKATERGVQARVHPTMIPESHPLASVGSNFNAIFVHGDAVGPTLHYGQGAGMMPTASAVLGDVLDAARLAPGPAREEPDPSGVDPMEDLVVPYYLRFTVTDRPGVLGKLAGALGDRGISIASVVQPKRKEGRAVPVVIRTHASREGDVRAALADIEALDFTADRPHVIRIETQLGDES